MNLFCPSCEAAYSGAGSCPRCGGRLVTPAEAFALPADLPPPPPDLIRPTGFARVVVGTLLGLGLFFAGGELADVAASAAGAESGWRSEPAGVAVGAGVLAAATAVAGLLAGAGRPVGAVTGLLAGVGVAGVGVLLGLVPGPPLVALGVATVLAATAGVVGAKVWPSAAEPNIADAIASRGSSLGEQLAEVQKRFGDHTGKPTRWVRVAVGTAVAVAGVLYADALRIQLRNMTGGAGSLGSPTAVPVVDLGLAGVLVAAGAVLAGSATGAGTRHGLIVGGLAAVGLIVLAPRRGDAAMQPIVTLLETFDVYPDLLTTPAIVTVGVAVVGTCVAAGWFGGQMFPPLAAKSQRTRLLAPD